MFCYHFITFGLSFGLHHLILLHSELLKVCLKKINIQKIKYYSLQSKYCPESELPWRAFALLLSISFYHYVEITEVFWLPQLAKGDVLIDFVAVLLLLIRHVTPLLPAAKTQSQSDFSSTRPSARPQEQLRGGCHTNIADRQHWHPARFLYTEHCDFFEVYCEKPRKTKQTWHPTLWLSLSFHYTYKTRKSTLTSHQRKDNNKWFIHKESSLSTHEKHWFGLYCCKTNICESGNIFRLLLSEVFDVSPCSFSRVCCYVDDAALHSCVLRLSLIIYILQFWLI